MKLHETDVVENNANLFTSRMKVPGGYIYRSYDKSNSVMAAVFVPHPKEHSSYGD